MQVSGPHPRPPLSDLAALWTLKTIGVNYAILDKFLKFSEHYFLHIYNVLMVSLLPILKDYCEDQAFNGLDSLMFSRCFLWRKERWTLLCNTWEVFKRGVVSYFTQATGIGRNHVAKKKKKGNENLGQENRDCHSLHFLYSFT